MKLVVVKGYVLLAWFLMPVVAYAQTGTELARQFVGRVNEVILFPLITLMLAIALLWFLYGGFMYVANADNDTERQRGRSHMVWGIVGLLVMVSAMAILEVAANTFGVANELQNFSPRR